MNKTRGCYRSSAKAENVTPRSGTGSFPSRLVPFVRIGVISPIFYAPLQSTLGAGGEKFEPQSPDGPFFDVRCDAPVCLEFGDKPDILDQVRSSRPNVVRRRAGSQTGLVHRWPVNLGVLVCRLYGCERC